jgi:hypothetical protein
MRHGGEQTGLWEATHGSGPLWRGANLHGHGEGDDV